MNTPAPNLRPPRPRRGRARGFTLLELVIAMGMIAILALSLYASMRVAFRAKSSADAAVADVRTIEVAMEFVRADLLNVLPARDPDATTFTLAAAFLGTNRQGGGGEADHVEFYTTAETGSRPADVRDGVQVEGDIKRVELTVETPASGNGRPALVRRITRNLLTQMVPEPEVEVLCRGVASFGVRYFDGTDWQDEWDSTQRQHMLPRAVEVTLVLEPTDGRPIAQARHHVRVFPLACATLTPETTTDSTEGGTTP